MAAIPHRWGFHHAGRFADAHQRMYGETPLQALALHAELTKPKGCGSVHSRATRQHPPAKRESLAK